MFKSERYVDASKRFAEVQTVAAREGNRENLYRGILSEGECYYALDLTQELKETLDKFAQAYGEVDSTLNPGIHLELESWRARLEGDYYYCRIDEDPSAAANSARAYRQAGEYLEKLSQCSYSDSYEMELDVLLQRNLLNLYYKQADYASALNCANSVYRFYKNMITPSNSGYDYRCYVDAHRSRAMVRARLGLYSDAIEEVINVRGYETQPTLWRTLGKILMMQGDSTGVDNRREAKKLYSKYLAYLKARASQQLTSLTETQQEQYWLSVHDFLYDCYRLEDAAPEMLYDLALFSKGYLVQRARGNAREYTWKEVRKALTAQDCAIEFVQYRGKNDAKQLGAFVLRKNSTQPQFVPLGSVSELEQLRLSNHVTLKTALYGDNQAQKDALYNDTELPSKLWTDKLMQAIGTSRRVYFAPDGLLQVLAIEYLMPDSTKECHRLSSTRVLVEPSKVGMQRLLLCGGLDYNTRTENSGDTIGNDTEAYRLLSQKMFYFKELPGTRRELDSIYKTLTSNISTTRIDTLTGSEATEEVFLGKLTKAPSLIHLSTHGYFAGTIGGSDVRPTISNRSLSESGLVLSGANYNLTDHTFDPTHRDGFLTAKELARQSLSHVGLMVLSACCTGVGYVTDDGVYGFQRSLKQAGVGRMMLSLWSVNDDATAALMTRFYGELSKDTSGHPDIYRAFTAARKALLQGAGVERYQFSTSTLKRTKTIQKFNKPRYTNAFILIDVL
jgi:hypothetical protein